MGVDHSLEHGKTIKEDKRGVRIREIVYLESSNDSWTRPFYLDFGSIEVRIDFEVVELDLERGGSVVRMREM